MYDSKGVFIGVMGKSEIHEEMVQSFYINLSGRYTGEPSTTSLYKTGNVDKIMERQNPITARGFGYRTGRKVP